MKSNSELLADARYRRAVLESAFLAALNQRPAERRATMDLYVPKLADINAEIFRISGLKEEA